MTAPALNLIHQNLSYEEWLNRYQPIPNPIDPNASFDGLLIETYGPELKFIMDQPMLRIWTLVDDGETMAIANGIHFVNRMGFFVTRMSHDPSFTTTVRLDD